MIKKFLQFIKNGFKSDNSVPVQDSSIEEQKKPAEPKCQYSGNPFYILKNPISKKQWDAVMPQGNSHVFSWDEMHSFIKELNKLLGITLEVPTSAHWIEACKAYGYLRNSIDKYDISFHTYDRSHGRIMDPNSPHCRRYVPCEGTKSLPWDLYVSMGNGHDAIALSLITYDSLDNLADNEILKSEDFVFVQV
ncbi:MAG: hypothetical protein K2M12_03905 [Muribaculaceae bacterium]|nr:hypothetical protein [Muribaculaceae bacterium]